MRSSYTNIIWKCSSCWACCHTSILCKIWWLSWTCGVTQITIIECFCSTTPYTHSIICESSDRTTRNTALIITILRIFAFRLSKAISVNCSKSCRASHAIVVIKATLTIRFTSLASPSIRIREISFSTRGNTSIVQLESWWLARFCFGTITNTSSESIIRISTGASTKDTGPILIVRSSWANSLAFSIKFFLSIIADWTWLTDTCIYC